VQPQDVRVSPQLGQRQRGRWAGGV
jgi:hypothetical protein